MKAGSYIIVFLTILTGICFDGPCSERNRMSPDSTSKGEEFQRHCVAQWTQRHGIEAPAAHHGPRERAARKVETTRARSRDEIVVKKYVKSV